MNYYQNYFDYINYVKTLKRTKNDTIYYELHHILPRSMGGSNTENNLVLLTAREHYLAHYLLWKIYNNVETQNAFWIFNNGYNNKSSKLLSSKMFEKLRINRIESISGGRNPFATKIYCFEKNEVYTSVIEASKALNIPQTSISNVCQKRRKTAYNFHFVYYEDYLSMTEEDKENLLKKDKQIKKEKIKIYSPQIKGKIFESIEDAKKYIGKNINISECLRGIRKKAGGIEWKYYTP